MAGGTTVSRATGLLRVLVLAWSLGFSPLADAYNLANTIPNMLFDIVLGGILGATFIPVFVEQLALQSERRAWRSISSVVSAATVVLLIASALAWCGAPWIIQGFTFLQHASPAHQAALVQQRAVATQFLRWFTPQIFFYGVIGIATALLNIRSRFGAAAWTPVANNIVCIAVLVWFHLVDPSPTLSALSSSSTLLWLGLGTTAGVAVQFGLLFPALARSDLGRLRFRWDLRDPAVRAVARLGSWTFGVVMANQASLYVVLAFAFASGGSGPVSAYTYGWSFMQVPYAVVVVSVISVLTPQLAGFATELDFGAFTTQLAKGVRQSLVIIMPCTAVLVVLAQPIAGILLHHGSAPGHLLAGTSLAILSVGLPGFTIFQLSIRGLQALQRARDVFWLYVVENALTILFCFALGRHTMAGLTGAVSLSYAIAAVLALATLALHHIPLYQALRHPLVRRSVLASLAMALVMAAVYAGFNWTSGVGLDVRTLGALVVGAGAYALALSLQPRRGRGV